MNIMQALQAAILISNYLYLGYYAQIFIYMFISATNEHNASLNISTKWSWPLAFIWPIVAVFAVFWQFCSWGANKLDNFVK